jgi:hypothetical protein
VKNSAFRVIIKTLIASDNIKCTEGIPYLARAGYDKINIKDEKDLFTLDERSFLFAELGYKPYPYILVSMVYRWTFSPVRDADDNIVDYKTQKKIEPKVSFIYPLSF